MASQLGDFLAGVGGAPVNRPALDAYVATSQAKNGLVSAQTQEALLNAQDKQDEMAAKDRIQTSLGNYLGAVGDPHPNEHAALVTDQFRAGGGKFKELEEGVKTMLANRNTQVIADPNADPNMRAAADQANNPNANPYQVDQGQLIPRFQGAQGQTQQPTVFQTPGSQATQQSQLESARLHGAQADAGGFNPHAGGIADLPPEQQAAINQAMHDGRLNFKDVNSRNIGLIGSMAINNPNYNFNGEAADAALSRNANFQQRSKVMDTMPGLMSNLVTLGKKLSYPDLQVAGQVKKFFQGQTNDPDLAAYAGARNDVLLKMAGIMRGVGMSDHATMMEEEALKPTLSGPALDSWLKSQMSVIQPLMDAQKSAAHIGSVGTSYDVKKTPQGGNVPSPDDPLGLR